MISIYLVLFFLLSFLYDMLHVEEHASKTALYLLHMWDVELISGSFTRNYGEKVKALVRNPSAVAWVRLCHVIKAAGARLSDEWREEKERQEQQRLHHTLTLGWCQTEGAGEVGTEREREREGNKLLFLKK